MNRIDECATDRRMIRRLRALAINGALEERTRPRRSYYIDLNSDEIAEIDRLVNGKGGFETFLRKLQGEVNHATGALKLSAEDLDYIPHAAFDYADGGFESRLLKIFGRILGPRLGRVDESPSES